MQFGKKEKEGLASAEYFNVVKTWLFSVRETLINGFIKKKW